MSTPLGTDGGVAVPAEPAWDAAEHNGRRWHVLSQSAEYALRAILYLAARSDHDSVRVGEVADALGVPQNYLSKILGNLVHQGILTSQRGPHGGFRLARDPDDLTLAQVIAPFDPMEEQPKCLLMERRCSEAHPCVAHHEWRAIARRVRTFFRRTTVSGLIREAGQHPPVLSPGG